MLRLSHPEPHDIFFEQYTLCREMHLFLLEELECLAVIMKEELQVILIYSQVIPEAEEQIW